MKFNTIYTLCLAAFAMTACSEDIDLGGVGTENIEFPQGGVVYVTDAQGKRNFSTVEFRDRITSELNIHTQTPRATATAVKFQYDENVLTEYNRKNNTQYKALPANLVQFANDGVVTLEAGKTLAIAEYTLTSDGSLDPTESYVLPVRASVSSGDAQLGSVDATRLIYVRDLSGIPDCTKYVPGPDGSLVPGVKIFSCMEVNDTNPLNNLSFTLGNEGVNKGKCLYDALIIFSANVNFNKETGRVYILCNENVQALLDYRDKYLKPLQDRGIKIILGLLGNHDGSGLCNLSDATARDFAQECKALADAYGLDGFFFDDEYSEYSKYNLHLYYPGFVPVSNTATSRLVYEIKKANPDRLTVAYAYSGTSSLQEVDGVRAGEYCDYALHDYGGSSDLSNQYPGMPKSNQGMRSQEFNRGRFATEYGLNDMVQKGYGSHMIFAMDPYRSNASRQLQQMDLCARCFYGNKVVFDGIKYPKDWK